MRKLSGGDYNNATADHIGITVGTKGQSGNAGIAIGTGADSKKSYCWCFDRVVTQVLLIMIL